MGTKNTFVYYLVMNPRDTTDARAANAAGVLPSRLDDSVSLTAGRSEPAPLSVCTTVTESCFEPLRGGGGESDINSNSPSNMGVPGVVEPMGPGRKGLRGGLGMVGESGVESERKLGSLRMFMMCSPRPNGGRRGSGWSCEGMDGSLSSSSLSKSRVMAWVWEAGT